MKNYEKYAEEIKNYNGENFCRDFIRPIILKIKHDVLSCKNIDCWHCGMLQNIWLLENYEEPKVDWSKVAVDTPILVRDNEDDKWEKRHFAEYEDGRIYAWNNGLTGWFLNYDSGCMTAWKYAKLAENEE